MGHVQSIQYFVDEQPQKSRPKKSKKQPTPTVDSWRRKDYYDRLGIQKNAKSASFSSFGSAPPNGYASFSSIASGPPEVKGTKSASLSHGANAPNEIEAVPSGPSEPTSKTTFDESEENNDVTYLDLQKQDDFRVSFLRRLSYEKVWVPPAQRPAKSQTCIIFDWDDTLLCTSFLNHRQELGLPPLTEQHLQGIAAASTQLLETALQLGNTFIITNAMSGWVEYSAAKYVPSMLPVLEKVRIISARSRYEGQYPRDVSKWKVNAFLDVRRQMDSQIITNLNSLGDAHYEMEATHVMGDEFANALIKTVKFKEQPTPEELLKELELVVKNFERIVTNARNLKVSLERK